MAMTNHITNNIIKDLDIIKLEGFNNWRTWKFLNECSLGSKTGFECCLYYTAGTTGSGPNLPNSPVTCIDFTAGHPFMLTAKDITKFPNNERQVRHAIVKNLSREVVDNVISCPSAKDIWTRLVQLYEQGDYFNIITLKRQFCSHQMQEATPINHHIGQMQTWYDQMRRIGDAYARPLNWGMFLTASLPGFVGHFCPDFTN